MMEIRQKTDYVKHHIQKDVFFLVAMGSFAAWFSESGYRVQYLCLNDIEDYQCFEDNLRQIIKTMNINLSDTCCRKNIVSTPKLKLSPQNYRSLLK